jgi:hypothetical protein
MSKKARPHSETPQAGEQVGDQSVPAGGVRVRMYRQGLGDCFLLTFPGHVGRPVFMLIDCGVILGTPKPEPIMTKVAKDIQQHTGGHIDVLVATHEHWDHLSGFIQAQDDFKQFTIDNVWLAWTEDPANKLAKSLKAQRRRALAALHVAADQLRANRAAGAPPSPVEEVLGFFGGLGVSGGGRTEDALRFLKDHGKTVRFCHPNETPLAIPGVPGARVFVLGPPEDESLIKKNLPTKKGQETYFQPLGLTLEEAFFAAIRDRVQGEDDEKSMEDQELSQLTFPFDERLKISVDHAKESDFFNANYGFKTNAGDAWRRIDDDWLGAAGPLALQLDSSTNNTSLALAIELVGTGKVLLFPGDAQVGNWMSWQQCSWKIGDNGKADRSVTAADLLARTVLYKVGHHASHNATLRANGLELMTSPELTAMIPVDHAMAVKKRWDMPFRALLDRLQEKTSGRVLRIDKGLGDKPDDVSAARWKAFVARTGVSDLAIDYVVG